MERLLQCISYVVLLIFIFCQDQTKNASAVLRKHQPEKPKMLYDYETNAVIYKNILEAKCYLYLFRVTNSIQKPTLHELSLKSHQNNQLSYQQIQTVADTKIVEFCQGLPIYLLNLKFINNRWKNEQTNLAYARHKRSSQNFFTGPVRGQSQSQYLNFGNNGQAPGKAEAEASHGISKAIVSGTNGMGQAQSQSTSLSCDECYVQEQIRHPIGPPVMQPSRPGSNGQGHILQPGQPGFVPYAPGGQILQPGQATYGPGQVLQPSQPTYGPGGQILQPGKPTYGPGGQILQPSRPGFPTYGPGGQILQPGLPTYSPDHILQPGSPNYGPGGQTMQPGQPGSPTYSPGQVLQPGQPGYPTYGPGGHVLQPGQPSNGPGQIKQPGQAGSPTYGPAVQTMQPSQPNFPTYGPGGQLLQPGKPIYGPGQVLQPNQPIYGPGGHVLQPGQPTYGPGQVMQPSLPGSPTYDPEGHVLQPGQPTYGPGQVLQPGQSGFPTYGPSQTVQPSQPGYPTYGPGAHVLQPSQPTYSPGQILQPSQPSLPTYGPGVQVLQPGQPTYGPGQVLQPGQPSSPTYGPGGHVLQPGQPTYGPGQILQPSQPGSPTYSPGQTVQPSQPGYPTYGPGAHVLQPDQPGYGPGQILQPLQPSLPTYGPGGQVLQPGQPTSGPGHILQPGLPTYGPGQILQPGQPSPPIYAPGQVLQPGQPTYGPGGQVLQPSHPSVPIYGPGQILQPSQPSGSVYGPGQIFGPGEQILQPTQPSGPVFGPGGQVYGPGGQTVLPTQPGTPTYGPGPIYRPGGQVLQPGQPSSPIYGPGGQILQPSQPGQQIYGPGGQFGGKFDGAYQHGSGQYGKFSGMFSGNYDVNHGKSQSSYPIGPSGSQTPVYVPETVLPQHTAPNVVQTPENQFPGNYHQGGQFSGTFMGNYGVDRGVGFGRPGSNGGPTSNGPIINGGPTVNSQSGHSVNNVPSDSKVGNIGYPAIENPEYSGKWNSEQKILPSYPTLDGTNADPRLHAGNGLDYSGINHLANLGSNVHASQSQEGSIRHPEHYPNSNIQGTGVFAHPGYVGNHPETGLQSGYPKQDLTGTNSLQPGYSAISSPGNVFQHNADISGTNHQGNIPGYSNTAHIGPSEIRHPGVGAPVNGNNQWSSNTEQFAKDANTEVQTSIQQIKNETQASASAQGVYDGGNAQSHVSGVYSGSGSFSASAGTNDGKRGAQTQVSGGKEGALGSAQGLAGVAQSQVQVEMSSQTGATSASAQTNGWNHGTNTQLQGGIKGGMADAQANGPGSTSSQAQIGFIPHDDTKKDEPNSIFTGGGTAGAQSGTHAGQSQVQLQGKFYQGIRYIGSAQAGSGNGLQPINQAQFENFKLSYFKPIDLNSSILNTSESIHSKTDVIKSNVISNAEETSSISPIEDNEFTTVMTNIDDYSMEDYDYADEDEYENDKGAPTIISQATRSQKQHIIIDPLEGIDAVVMQAQGDRDLPHGTVLQPGQKIPGTLGYQIPHGFRGVVKSVSSGPRTTATGYNSQAQTVSLIPGTGKVIYKQPAYSVSSHTGTHNGKYSYGSGYTYQPVKQQLKTGINFPSFVSTSTSETGYHNIHTGKKTPSVYYSQSSSCGYFTNTCVYNGKTKICMPKAKTNPDGSPVTCRNVKY